MRRWKHLETVRRNTRPFTRGSKTAKLLSAFADASCEGTAAWLRWNEGNCAERITDVDGRYCVDSFEVWSHWFHSYFSWFYMILCQGKFEPHPFWPSHGQLHWMFKKHAEASISYFRMFWSKLNVLSHQFACTMHPDISPSQFTSTYLKHVDPCVHFV
jgi:hypothetical protein